MAETKLKPQSMLQIDHVAIANRGTNTHAQLDTGLTNSADHIAAAADYAVAAKGVTNGDTHDHVGGDGALIPAAALAAEAWTGFTPTLGQTVAVTCTVTNARYIKLGRLAVVQISLIATSAGNANGNIDIGSIPAAIAPHNNLEKAGTFECFDSGTTYYAGSARFGNDSIIAFHRDASASGLGSEFTLANGDVIQVVLTYETAA